MTERSKQIFGNDIAPGAYKKQSGQSRNLSVNSGMTAQKIIQLRSRQTRISGRNLVSLISAWEKKELRTFIRRKESSSEISVWDLVITASPWRSHPQHMRWGMNRTGWI